MPENSAPLIQNFNTSLTAQGLNCYIHDVKNLRIVHRWGKLMTGNYLVFKLTC
jgi:hypothetical protein